jgi:ferredoxin--NADP+ reductase
VFEVLSNELLAPEVHRLVIEAPRVAAARQPGQFVIVRADERGERIPLTIADADAAAGTITLIVQVAGVSTGDIAAAPAGGALQDVAGPLGKPTEMRKWGKVLCVGGGVGTAVVFPLAKALSEAGNEVSAIVGAKSEPYVILRNELAAFCEEVLVTTEDGSLGRQGLVTDAMEEILADETRRPDAVFAVGPVAMMAAVAELTRSRGIKTVVSLNPIMVDGTGMCGGCRVTVGGEVRFACVEGPEFDGHLVDFPELARRQAAYEEDYCRLQSKARPQEEKAK